MKAARHERHASDGGQMGGPLIARSARRHAIDDEHVAASEPDVLFRVGLSRVERLTGSLEEFSREVVRDLLQVLRLRCRWTPLFIGRVARFNVPDNESRLRHPGNCGTI